MIEPRRVVMAAVIRYGAASVNSAIDGDGAYMLISQQLRERDEEISRLRQALLKWHSADYIASLSESPRL